MSLHGALQPPETGVLLTGVQSAVELEKQVQQFKNVRRVA